MNQNLPPILDACCGSRMMWFDKQNPLALFGDQRTESHTLCDGRSLEIKPDLEIDFRQMPFADESFHLVAFDPPHLKHLGASSWMAKKYGRLNLGWQADIQQGFSECLRVLKPNGVLIFKWNETQIKISEILSLIALKPLFGHTSGRHNKTIWMTFLKPQQP